MQLGKCLCAGHIGEEEEEEQGGNQGVEAAWYMSLVLVQDNLVTAENSTHRFSLNRDPHVCYAHNRVHHNTWYQNLAGMAIARKAARMSID